MMQISLEKAFQSGDKLTPPFELDLGAAGTLHVEALLRVLPGKRLVMKARRGNEVLLAKIFREKRSYWTEERGYEILRATKANTPERLQHGELTQGAYCFYRYIENLRPLKTVFDQANPEEKSCHMHTLLVLLGTMYQRGVCQQDLHLDNFAYAGDKLLALDPASCITIQKPGEQIKNLGLLLSQLSRKDWPAALREMQQQFPQYDNKQLQAVGQQSWKKRLRHFLKKIYRECTYVKYWNKKQGFMQRLDIYCVRGDCSESMKAALEAILHPLPNTTEYLKRGQSSLVYLLEVDGCNRVVKHSRNKTTERLLRRSFRRSRASNAWYFSHMLLEAGIHTPRPVALVERKIGPIVLESWFISEYVEGDNLLDTWLYSEPEVWQLAEIENLFAVMEDLKISHGDMKGSNLLVTENKMFLIDYDGMREHTLNAIAHYSIKKDRERLSRNWKNVKLGA